MHNYCILKWYLVVGIKNYYIINCIDEAALPAFLYLRHWLYNERHDIEADRSYLCAF